MKKIVFLIFFLIELQSILCIPRIKYENDTDQVCVRSPKKIDYSIPIRYIWRGKFYFSKDTAPECKNTTVTLKMKFIKYRNVDKYDFRRNYHKYKNYKVFNRLTMDDDLWYAIVFNDENQMDMVYSRDVSKKNLFTITCTYRNDTCPYYKNALYSLTDKRKNITYNGIRIQGKCVMMCIELEPDDFLTHHYCFQYSDALSGMKQLLRSF